MMDVNTQWALLALGALRARDVVQESDTEVAVEVLSRVIDKVRAAATTEVEKRCLIWRQER